MVSSPPPPQAQAQAQAYGAAGAGAHTQGALGGYALPEAAETYALPAQEGYYGANEAYEAPVAAGGAQVLSHMCACLHTRIHHTRPTRSHHRSLHALLHVHVPVT